MRVVIPAGGRGTRLRPLTHWLPKPLLPLGDRPILTQIIESLPAELPVTIVICAELLPFFQEWAIQLECSRAVELFVESETARPRGPVAAIAQYLRSKSPEDVLVLMSDSLLPFRLDRFVVAADSRLLLAAYAVADIREARRFGVVEVRSDGTVASFEEKPAQPKSPWVFTGCLHIPQRLVAQLDEVDLEQATQMGNLVEHYHRCAETIDVFPCAGEWQDIGSVDAYFTAHYGLLTSAQTSRLLRSGNHLAGMVYVHPTADVQTSRLSHCIIGAHASIRNAVLDGCFVQPATAIADRTASGMMLSRGAEVPIGSGATL